ncbi:MAG: FAD-binding oxidoreductase [Verrucomicrobiota bacterium]
MKIDHLIVGQGLAGSLLAWHLLQRNQRILVVDRDEEVTSSKVAAGLITPLSGPRFSASSQRLERLDKAHRFYWELEELAGQCFFHHHRITRLFRDEKEVASWKKGRARHPEDFSNLSGEAVIDPDFIRAPLGGTELKRGGWLNLPAFLDFTQHHLLERASYAIANLDASDIITEPKSVRWKNIEAKTIIFAQGWRGNQNSYFDWIPMNPAAGDILDLEFNGPMDESRVIHSGTWLLPVGDGRFRAGSTYRHDFSENLRSDAGREEVIHKLSTFIRPEFHVMNHRIGIRPIIRRSRIFMGRHPFQPGIAFFNGLGSKGVLNGPWYAEKLASHLVHGDPLPPESDLRAHLV